jgi:hypothetical protein
LGDFTTFSVFSKKTFFFQNFFVTLCHR